MIPIRNEAVDIARYFDSIAPPTIRIHYELLLTSIHLFLKMIFESLFFKEIEFNVDPLLLPVNRDDIKG